MDNRVYDGTRRQHEAAENRQDHSEQELVAGTLFEFRCGFRQPARGPHPERDRNHNYRDKTQDAEGTLDGRQRFSWFGFGHLFTHSCKADPRLLASPGGRKEDALSYSICEKRRGRAVGQRRGRRGDRDLPCSFSHDFADSVPPLRDGAPRQGSPPPLAAPTMPYLAPTVPYPSLGRRKKRDYSRRCSRSSWISRASSAGGGPPAPSGLRRWGA